MLFQVEACYFPGDPSFLSARSRITESLERKLAAALAQQLADGRPRWVRQLPDREQPADGMREAVRRSRSLICLLTRALDAEVGEYVTQESLPITLTPGGGDEVQTVHFRSLPLGAEGEASQLELAGLHEHRTWRRARLGLPDGETLTAWRREA